MLSYFTWVLIMAAVSPITLLFRAVDQANPVLRNLVGQVKSQFEVVTALSFAYNQVTQTIQQLAGQGQKAYQLLIGQNVELQEQLLSTQASLAATNKVISGGIAVSDPTKAIQALTEPVNEAIARLRKGSLELSGVTSNQLVPVFQIVAQQSASIGANLNDSADLALSAAAAFSSLSIPLDQARQEINSILTAQISSDSQLAKTLGLNNQMVNQWKAQGTLVQKLTERLSAFRSANALQSQTISGITSNIQEQIDEITRVAGTPLLQPIVNQLNIVYKFLQDNKDAIQQIAVDVVNFFLQIGAKLGEAVAAIAPALQELGGAIFTQLSNEASAASKVILILVDGLTALLRASEPLIQVLADITKSFAAFTSTDLGNVILQATLLTSLFSKFIPVLIAVQANFVRAATAAILFNNAAGGNAAALTALRSFAPALAAIAASYAAAGGGAVGFAAALGTATASMKAFAVAAGAAMAPLLPLIAIGGALTVALIVKQTGDLKNVNEELETFREQNDLLADESIKIATKLKALNDAEKENGKLTEEQAKKRTGYQRIAAGQVDALKQQLEAVKGLQPANEDQKNAQSAQIKQLEIMISLLQKQSGGVKLQARDLEVLGNAYQQLQKKVADAQAQFEQGGGGDSSRFQSAAKELVQLTQKQLELGQITEAQAIARLDRVRNDGRVEYEVQLSAQDAITKARQGEVDKRVKATEDEQQQIQALIAGEEISQFEGQRRISENKIKQLQIQLDAVRVAIKEEEKLRASQVQQQLAGIDKQIAEAEARRQKAEGGGDKGGARIAREDLARLQSQRNAVEASLKIDSDSLRQKRSQEKKFDSEIIQARAERARQERQERLKDFDEQQQILDGQYAAQLVGEQEYNTKSLQLSRDKAQEELKQLADQRTKLIEATQGRSLSPEEQQGLAEGLEAIAAREGVIRKQQLTAQDDYQQKSLQLLERSQKEALDAVSQSESDRLLEITKLEQEQTIRKVEADKLRVESTGDRLREEIRLEEERLSQLEALPPYGDPAKEEGRQAEIRASRKKTTDLTKSLIDNEIQQRDALYRVIEDQINQEIQGIQNRATAQSQDLEAQERALEQQQRLGDLAVKSLEMQNQLLEARKNLVSSIGGFLQGQLDILKETTKSEREKKQIAETQAEIRLNMVKAQAAIEKEILLSNLQQKDAALEQEKIQLRIQKIQAQSATLNAQADVLTAQAEQKKVEEDPNSTKGQKEAAALRVTAALGRVDAANANLGAIASQESLLGQREGITRRQAQLEIDRQERDSQLEIDQATLNLAQNRRRRGQGRREMRELREDILRRGGVTSARDFGSNVDFSRLGGDLVSQIAQLQAGVIPAGNVPVSQFVGGGVNTAVPQATTAQALQALMSQKQPIGTVNINVTNEFANADNRAADTFTQRIRKELYDVGVLLTK